MLATLTGCATEVDYSAPASDPAQTGTAEPPAETLGSSERPLAEGAGVSADSIDTQDILDGIIGTANEATDAQPHLNTKPASDGGVLADDIQGVSDASSDSGTDRPAQSPPQSSPPKTLAAEPSTGEPSIASKQTEDAARSLPDELRNDRYAFGLFGGLTGEEPAAPNNQAPSDGIIPPEAIEAQQQADNPPAIGVKQGSDAKQDNSGAAERLIDGSPLFVDKPPRLAGKRSSADPSIDPAKQTEPLIGEGRPPINLPPAEDPNAVAPIRLDPQNTRHLAWLLGAKAAVVTLADLAGVGQARQSGWEVEALANMLGVSRPNDVAALASSPSPEAAIATLIRQARTTARELSKQHGADHAALMEIALKSNALLVLYESRPALAAAVLQAIQQAAKRAGLPKETLTPLTEALNRRASSDAVNRAVHRVHREVERLLRGASRSGGSAPTGAAASGAVRRS